MDHRTRRGISLLAAGTAVGLGVGAWLTRRRSGPLSVAERDRPEDVAEAIRAVDERLVKLKFNGPFHGERHYQRGLANNFRRTLPLPIEEGPATQYGRPDILVNNALALELKVKLSKSAIDRAIGQCLKYSEAWPTWLLVFDSGPSVRAQLEERLVEAGGGHIWVIPFTK